jgi:hypothetical protein
MRHMAAVRKVSACGVALLVAATFNIGMKAQVGDPATLIKEKLVSQIKLTKANGANDDIVTAGDVVLLHKDGLKMCATGGKGYSNIFSNGMFVMDTKKRAGGILKQGLLNKMTGNGGFTDAASGSGCTERKFVSGEKFWITDIQNKSDGILVSVFSDPYNDQRYYGDIKFPFVKGSAPNVDDFVKLVGEVVTVAPSDDKDKGGQNDQAAKSEQPAQPAQPATPAPAPIQAIAPPPPPADAPPPSIAIGQTKDMVVAGFGQPVRTAKLAGTKEIYFYKDMKVTFTNGKVSNVE